MQRDAVVSARLVDECSEDLGRQPASQRMTDCCRFTSGEGIAERIVVDVYTLLQRKVKDAV